MTQLVKGWKEQLMMSLFEKEATYNAGVTMNGTTACAMLGFTAGVEFPDVIVTDKEDVTNTEFGTDQEITEKRVKLTYTEPKAKPNTLIGLAALVLGDSTPTQDGTENAWSHRIVAATVGTALPSISVEHLRGGIQRKYNGVKGNSLKISGEENGYVSCEAELLGSGTRDTSAASFASAISESWMPVNLAKCWLESGADISISATLAQDAEDISSATPEALSPRVKSFEFSFMNNLAEIAGFGGAGLLQGLDYGRRTAEFKASLLFKDATELDHYLNQDVLAIELDLKGAQITGTSNFYYGFQLIIPRFKLKTAALPQGGVADSLTVDLEGDIQDDGANPVVIIEGYNAKNAYLA